MKVTKGILSALVLGSVGFAASAFAADAVATKTSELTLFPDLQMTLQARHLYNVKTTADGDVADKPVKWQLRPNLTNKWFNKKLTTELYWGMEKSTDEGRFKMARTELLSYVDVPIGSSVNLQPYADIFMPYQGSGTDGAVGFDLAVNGSVSGKFGSLDPFVGLDSSANVNSRETDRTITKSSDRPIKDYGLSGTDSAGTNQAVQKANEEDPTYTVTPYVGGTYKLPVATKWSLTALTRIDNTYSPEHTVGAKSEVETKYVRAIDRWDLISLKYTADSKMSFYNETRVFHSGLYALKDGDVRYHNRFVMNYKL